MANFEKKADNIGNNCHDSLSCTNGLETSARLIVMGEVCLLQTALRNSDPSLNSYHLYGQRYPSNNKSSKMAISSILNKTEEDDDNFIDDATTDGQSSHQHSSSIYEVYSQLKRLKEKLAKNLNVLTEESYLEPFFTIIKSKEINGRITSLALQSINKFLNYDLISYTEEKGSAQAIGESVIKARFIGKDNSSDDQVVMRILWVFREVIVRRFKRISNQTVYEIMLSCFRLAFESRSTELLRRDSEHVLTEMVQVLFSRVKDFDDIKDFDKMRTNNKFSFLHTNYKKAESSRINMTSFTTSGGSEFVNKQGIKFSEDVSIPQHETNVMSPYCDLVCIYEVLNYLTSLINPLPDSQNTEDNIQVGLNLLIVAFETAVHSIGEKQKLLDIVKDSLCWNIILLLQHDRHPITFSLSLRLAFIIFTSLRVHLKYQMEALFIRLMDLITTENGSLEIKEIALDYLYSFFQQISYLPFEIFINYDCDPYASNLLEDLLNLFSKNCFSSALSPLSITSIPAQNVFSQIQKTSLEALFACLNSLHRANLKLKSQVVLRCYDGPTSVLIKNTDITVQEQNMGTKNIVDAIKPEEEVLSEIVVIDSKFQESSKGIKENRTEFHRKSSKFVFPKTVTEVEQLKQRKKLLWMASEQFNAKPSKGINFLQERKLITSETDIVDFIRDNFKLDKRMIGEYLANKKNLSVLQAFVESFWFQDLRIDEALRMYLESFRLPGEAPLISLLLEQFSRHWFETNGQPFENEDAAFSLAYAVIMLNVDQHNTNARKQNVPMTCEDFISNLRHLNGGKDFDHSLLENIYLTIRSNEIIMPAEQHGIVRERYLWKCLLRRSTTDSGRYWIAKETICSENVESEIKEISLPLLNGPIFKILWGPALAAMTFVFDKIKTDTKQTSTLTRKILDQGFTICAPLCATYGHLDNLIISLCKFTINSAGGPTKPLLSFKSKLAGRCLFDITRNYASEIRDSWTEIVKMILNWFVAKFLEETLEFEDFALDGKKIKIKRKGRPKPSTKNNEGSFSFLTLYSYFSSNQDGQSEGGDQYKSTLNNEENECDCNLQSSKVIRDYCKPLSIIEESKFLIMDSLVELIKALTEVEIEVPDEEADDVEAFKLEMLMQIVLLNRDRASVFWPNISNYLTKISSFCAKSDLLAERYISAIFRLAIRFIPRHDDFSEQIYQHLEKVIYTFESRIIQEHYTATALHCFISHSHTSIVKSEVWTFIFEILLYIGVGYKPEKAILNESKTESFVQSENEQSSHGIRDPIVRGYTSDSEIESHKTDHKSINPYKLMTGDSIGTGRGSAFKILNIYAYERCIEILRMILCEILPKNVIKCEKNDEKVNTMTTMAVDTLRKFVEASVKIHSNFGFKKGVSHNTNLRRSNSRFISERKHEIVRKSSDSEDEFEETSSESKDQRPKIKQACSLKLLDLMHHFHMNAKVSSSVAHEYLWCTVWCPLLQGIALLCCDSRKPVRACALTSLQQTLVNPDLESLSAHQWESCFNKVLFPLLAKLLEPLNPNDPLGMDETRMRVTNLLSKVYLHHLMPLLSLPTFTALWLTILDFLDKYMKTDLPNDFVREAIPESLKNMLLVMNSANCMNTSLMSITWDRINCFLPSLKNELTRPTQITSLNAISSTNEGLPATNPLVATAPVLSPDVTS